MNMILPERPNGTVCVNSDAVTQWHELFREAEKRIKEIEHGSEGLDIPAINELRYVAFHIVEVLTSTSNAAKEEQSNKVLSHLQRAIYDACEALISLQLMELRRFQEDYRLVVVSDVIKNYQELMERAENASSLIKGHQRGHDSREKYYEVALEHVDELSRINLALRTSREELNKRVVIERRDSRRWVIGIVVIFVIGVITAAATAADALLAIASK